MTLRQASRCAGAGFVLLLTSATGSATVVRRDTETSTKHPPPLAMLPSVSRVKIVVGPGSALVIEDVTLPRGEWKGEALDFYVAFGAPGVPRAIDAILVPIVDGALEARDDEQGVSVTTSQAPRRPPSAHPLLGRDAMAGIVVHVQASQLTRALASSGLAALRVRSLVPIPDAVPDAEEASILVRLGASRGTPLTLGRIVVGNAPSQPPVTDASAHLCGDAAVRTPLAVTVEGALRVRSARDVVAPVLAVRHASDDLCVSVRRGLPRP